ncbi:LysM peptidoglycan-binding domain-containing protein [Hippea alviniae]|uniref:LysM peptidoglycan-binding domain-containing protein n=1 Tax=Hippea alviniae TaxID=1279027 RepID=UPI0003B6CCE3|nr:LysM peptidoglycan-binding domain-containing protein [Hippea alviniae]
MRKIVLVILLIGLMTVNSYGWEKLYIVKKGDTLWDISKKFYKNPFYWGKLWYNNTYINDPDLIFPGEILLVGKHGLEIYSLKKKPTKKPKPVLKERKYVSAVWFEKDKFYSTCGNHLCVWEKKQFEVAKMKFDTYSHVEVSQGDTIYLVASKESLPEKLYVYRKNEDLSHYNHNFDPVYLPIGEIKVEKKIKDGVFKAKIVSAFAEITPDDVVSSVYPFISVKDNPPVEKVGDIKVKEILVANNEFQSGMGMFLFFKASKKLPIVLGKKVILARLNENAYEPIDIGEGVVVSQYDEYIGIFFPASNGLKEMPDRTQEYVLR